MRRLFLLFAVAIVVASELSVTSSISLCSQLVTCVHFQWSRKVQEIGGGVGGPRFGQNSSMLELSVGKKICNRGFQTSLSGEGGHRCKPLLTTHTY